MTEENPYATSPASPMATARRQLFPVALGLLVGSVLHIVGGLFYFAFVYSLVTAPDADPADRYKSVVYCMYYGISILYCLLLASGAFSMLRRGSYLWAMAVCVMALIPFLGPCYFFAIPFGIWGIVILRRPEVQASFAGY